MNAKEFFKDFTPEQLAFITDIQKERSAMMEISCIRNGFKDIEIVKDKCLNARNRIKEFGINSTFQWEDI